RRRGPVSRGHTRQGSPGQIFRCRGDPVAGRGESGEERVRPRAGRMTGSTRSTMFRGFAWLALFIYLAALGGFLLQSVVGDTALFPLSYFFKWDMFPSHNTRGLRRVAIGRTVAGKYLQLYPSPFEQYRGGVHHDLTHVDLDARGHSYRTAVEKTLKKA